MVNLELIVAGEKSNFQFPEDWSEVSVGLYQKIAKVKGDTGNYVSTCIELVQIITGMDRKVIEKIDSNSITDLLKCFEFIKAKPNQDPKKTIKIDGEKYYLKSDMEKLNLGEVASIETLQEKYNNNWEEALSDMLCILLRKKDDNGKLEEFDSSFMERAELFESQVMIGDIYKVFLFFSSLNKE